MINDIAIMLLVGGVIRTASRRLNMMTVIGEIVAGLVVGPSLYHWVTFTTDLERIADIGVMILLFHAGMHLNLGELIKVGKSSVSVAIAGVALPLMSGYGAGLAFGESHNTSLFIGAALCATSIGITARVFSDLGQLNTVNARVVLGAAVIDDVIGLVVLVAASAIVQSGSFDIAHALMTVLVIGSFFLGVAAAKYANSSKIEKAMSPISQVFILFFFVSIGVRADIGDAFTSRGIIIICVLSVIALVTKFGAGFAARSTDIDKSLIGLGMVPRGEVGLIFANTAVSLHVFDSTIYSAVVMVVLLTTVVTPPLLRRRCEVVLPSHE